MARYVDVEISRDLERFLSNEDVPRRRGVLKLWLEHLASFALAEQHHYVPHGETGYLESHLGRSGVHYAPGGFGGGGSYQIAIGVRRGSSKHPFFVHFGTANPEGQSPAAMMVGGVGMQGKIYPRGDRMAATVLAKRAPRSFMMEPSASLLRWGTKGDWADFHRKQAALTFQKLGEPRKFRAWVSGQRPQPFVYFSFVHTAVYTRGQLRTAARALFPTASPLGTRPPV